MTGPVTLAVEGTTDAAVARRLLHEADLQAGPEYVKNGKSALDQSLAGYNNAARFSCWLVLRDLDQDAACAPALQFATVQWRPATAAARSPSLARLRRFLRTIPRRGREASR